MDVESFRQWLDNDIQDIYLPEDVQMIHTDEREIEVSRRFGFAGSRGLSDAAYVGQYYTMFERAWAMTGYTDFLTYCYTDPDAVEFLLDRITENKIRIA